MEGTQSPRLPNIDAELYSWLNTIDGFLARAPLTRTEHHVASKCMENIATRCEQMQASSRPVMVPSVPQNGNDNIPETDSANLQRGTKAV